MLTRPPGRVSHEANTKPVGPAPTMRTSVSPVRLPTPGYFRTMGIPMLSGRDFNLADTSSEKSVAVISQAMANLFWPGENPIGKRFRISFTPETLREVAGVVGDIKERGLEVLDPVTMLYLPIRQDETDYVSLVVRGDGA